MVALVQPLPSLKNKSERETLCPIDFFRGGGVCAQAKKMVAK